MPIRKKLQSAVAGGTGPAVAATVATMIFSSVLLTTWAGGPASVPPASGPGASSFATPAGSQVDWQKEYEKLKAKVDKEFDQPPDKAAFDEHLRWMGVKAADRDKAGTFAAAAQNAGNPYWFERFRDLADHAQDSGKSTVVGAIMFSINLRLADGWQEAVDNANTFGRPLYARAKELDLNADEVRESVRCLMRYAIGFVESNSDNRMCLYYDREVVHGTDFDEQGNLLVPRGDYTVSCLPRSAFHTQSEGHPSIDADVGLSWVEQIRDVCRAFDLFEFNEATDLMEQYLLEKDEDYLGSGMKVEVLCMLPRDRGHAFFLKLAEDYNLPKAKEHIEGFYAKLKGKVEFEEEDGSREPAAGAVVTVTDPHDGTEWVVEADKKGTYEIEKVILHKTCGPFPITAEYKGYTEEDEYEGPLEEPDKSFEHEKDLVVRADAWEGVIAETWQMKAGEDESALAAIMGRGEYDAGSNWRVRVKFKRDRGNENVVIYALDEARLEAFSETLDMKALRMEREGRKIEMSGREKAVSRSRKLSRSECDLELAVNLKKKTYTVSGKIEVQGIPIEGEARLEVKVKPINVDEKESSEGTTGIDEEIEISGAWSGEKPERLQGSRDEMENLPTEFQEFFKALAGKIDWKFSWDLAKKKKG